MTFNDVSFTNFNENFIDDNKSEKFYEIWLQKLFIPSTNSPLSTVFEFNLYRTFIFMNKFFKSSINISFILEISLLS